MDGQEHILIISAGPTIHHSFPGAIRLLETVTHVFIFADQEIFFDAPHNDRQGQATKQAARDAIKKVKIAATTLGLVSTHVRIDEKSADSVREAFITIFGAHPGARYSFELSAGSKNLVLELFALSLWLDGDCYYSRDMIPYQHLAVPKITAKNLPANPNYERILQVLSRRSGPDKPGMENPQVKNFTRSYIFVQMSTWYVPVTIKGSPGKGIELRQSTLSFFLSNLEQWGFIREIPNKTNKKEKIYRITVEGELAMRFFHGRC